MLRALFLSSGSFASSCISFLIPIYLTRALSLENYGTFKQIFLLQSTLLIFLHFGLDSGLFYFIKSRKIPAGVFSLNAMVFEFLAGLAVCLIALPLAGPLAHLLKNESLASLLPSVLPIFIFSAATQHFEHLLVLKNELRKSVLISFTTDALKCLIIVGGFYFYRSLSTVFWGLSALYFLRFGFLLVTNLKDIGLNDLRLSRQWTIFKSQWKFSAPLGIGQWVSFFSKFDRYLVSAFTGLREFTYYSVGCFDVPFVNQYGNQLTDLMSFELANPKNNLKEKQRVWLSTKRHLFLVHLAVTFLLVLFARPLFNLVFSAQYVDSARYFQIYILSFLLLSLEADLVFRAFAKTREFMKLQFLHAGVVTVFVGLGAFYYGAYGALVGKVASDAVSLGVRLYFAKELLGLSFSRVIPWGTCVLGVFAMGVSYLIVF